MSLQPSTRMFLGHEKPHNEYFQIRINAFCCQTLQIINTVPKKDNFYSSNKILEIDLFSQAVTMKLGAKWISLKNFLENFLPKFFSPKQIFPKSFSRILFCRRMFSIARFRSDFEPPNICFRENVFREKIICLNIKTSHPQQHIQSLVFVVWILWTFF